MKTGYQGVLGIILIAGLILALAPVNVKAQYSSNRLFTLGQSPDNELSIQSFETRKQPVFINENIFYSDEAGQGSVITFPDFDGRNHEYKVIRRQEFVPGIISISAQSVKDPIDVLAISYHNGTVRGIIKNVTDNTYLELNYSNQYEMNTIAEIAPSMRDILECGLNVDTHKLLHGADSRLHTNHDRHESGMISAASSVPFTPHHIGLAELYDDEVVLDILMVYTPKAAQWALFNGGGILLNIANGMALNQIPLDNSNTGILMRVVHIAEVNYDEDADSVSTITLRRLTARPGGPFADDVGFFDNVHTMREQYGADFVAILALVNDTGGLGFLPTSAAGRPDLAFSLTRIQQMANSYTFVHELGHNLGNNHSRNQTSAVAGEMGGLFDYSTGWAWQNGAGERTATVMAYPEGGTRIPFFSSPEMFYDSFPTGSYTGTGSPADNVRSMREVKYIAANYRPTRFEPPAAALPALNSIEVQTGLGASDVVTLDIGNSGVSPLFWQIDFSAPEMGKPVLKSNQFNALAAGKDIVDGGYVTGSAGINFIESDSDGIVYQTTFGNNEGFLTGSFNAANNWKSNFNDSRIRFMISNINPTVGAQHLRFNKSDNFAPNTGLSINAPFLGLRPYGHYEVSMDLYMISDAGNADYRIIFNDDRTNNNSAEIVFDNRGFVFVRAINQSGAPGYIFAGNFNYNTHYKLKVVINPETHTLSYYLNDELRLSSGLLNGRIISQFRIFHNNKQTEGGFIDVDNVIVRVPYIGFSWLSANRYAGSVEPGENSNINLTFGGPDVEPGTYSGTLIIRTNDANASEQRIPITYTMDSVVSIDHETGLPGGFSLGQNYPNPFNPSTEIRFSLPADGPVNLEVFSIAGQKIVTLVDDTMPAGSHTASFNASGLASGLYIYRLTSGNWSKTRKMMLIK